MQVVYNIISDIEKIENQNVMYEAIRNKLNKSLVLYTENLVENETELTDDNYFKVVRMIAKRINL